MIAGIAAHWTGNPEEGAAIMQPLNDFGKPVANTIESKSFTSFQSFLDGGQPFGRTGCLIRTSSACRLPVRGRRSGSVEPDGTCRFCPRCR